METNQSARWSQTRYVATEKGATRVLVADDDPDVLKVVAFALRGFGFEVIQASDGDELLAKIAGNPLANEASGPPDIVVTDVRMPGSTGLEILELLRQANARTAVVLMSAYADMETRAKASELGVDAFFAKPFDVDELASTVVELAPTPTGSRD